MKFQVYFRVIRAKYNFARENDSASIEPWIHHHRHCLVLAVSRTAATARFVQMTTLPS